MAAQRGADEDAPLLVRRNLIRRRVEAAADVLGLRIGQLVDLRDAQLPLLLGVEGQAAVEPFRDIKCLAELLAVARRDRHAALRIHVVLVFAHQHTASIPLSRRFWPHKQASFTPTLSVLPLGATVCHSMGTLYRIGRLKSTQNLKLCLLRSIRPPDRLCCRAPKFHSSTTSCARRRIRGVPLKKPFIESLHFVQLIPN